MWVGKLPGKHASVTALAFAPDGRTFYTGDSKGWIIAWDTATHESKTLRQPPQPGIASTVHTLWPTPDGKRLLFKAVVTLWDAHSGERVTQFDWKTGKVEAVAFAPDGLTCVAGGFEKFVVFDLDL